MVRLPDIDTADELTYTNISSGIYNVCPGGGGEIVSGGIVDGSGNPVPNAAVTATRSAARRRRVHGGQRH